MRRPNASAVDVSRTAWGIGGALVLALAVIAGCGSGGGGSSPSSGGSSSSGSSSGSTGAPARNAAGTPIQHVFIIFKENHTFDNFFGNFPGANGVMSAVESTGQSVSLSTPTSDFYDPGSNGWDASHTDFHGGAMDQFDLAEHSIRPLFTKDAFVSYAGSSTVDYYTQTARKGVLCDNFFSSVMGPSLPNHLYMMAATAGGAIGDPSLTTGEVEVMDAQGNRSPHGATFTAAEIPVSLPNELEAAGLTWTYIEEQSTLNVIEDQGDGVRCIQVLDQMADISTRYIESTPDLDRNLAQILSTPGAIGNVTWIRPSALNCEHPGIGRVSLGATWTKQVVNQIARSPYWKDCAIFITFDDYGGFYDHVPPPQVDTWGLGFRVPCLIASPYARAGVVDHAQYEFCSILKFCEKQFGLPAMSTRDAAAADMTAGFDFTQAPRPASDFIVP